MRLYPDHECQCRHCHPERFPSGEDRQSEGHLAIRFQTGDWRAEVYLNDEKLSNCDEAIAGDDGLVVRLRPHTCCVHVQPAFTQETDCAYVERGHVRVVMPLDERRSG